MNISELKIELYEAVANNYAVTGDSYIRYGTSFNSLANCVNKKTGSELIFVGKFIKNLVDLDIQTKEQADIYLLNFSIGVGDIYGEKVTKIEDIFLDGFDMFFREEYMHAVLRKINGYSKNLLRRAISELEKN